MPRLQRATRCSVGRTSTVRHFHSGSDDGDYQHLGCIVWRYSDITEFPVNILVSECMQVLPVQPKQDGLGLTNASRTVSADVRSSRGKDQRKEQQR